MITIVKDIRHRKINANNMLNVPLNDYLEAQGVPLNRTHANGFGFSFNFMHDGSNVGEVPVVSWYASTDATIYIKITLTVNNELKAYVRCEGEAETQGIVIDTVVPNSVQNITIIRTTSNRLRLDGYRNGANVVNATLFNFTTSTLSHKLDSCIIGANVEKDTFGTFSMSSLLWIANNISAYEIAELATLGGAPRRDILDNMACFWQMNTEPFTLNEKDVTNLIGFNVGDTVLYDAGITSNYMTLSGLTKSSTSINNVNNDLEQSTDGGTVWNAVLASDTGGALISSNVGDMCRIPIIPHKRAQVRYFTIAAAPRLKDVRVKVELLNFDESVVLHTEYLESNTGSNETVSIFDNTSTQNYTWYDDKVVSPIIDFGVIDETNTTTFKYYMRYTIEENFGGGELRHHTSSIASLGLINRPIKYIGTDYQFDHINEVYPNKDNALVNNHQYFKMGEVILAGDYSNLQSNTDNMNIRFVGKIKGFDFQAATYNHLFGFDDGWRVQLTVGATNDIRLRIFYNNIGLGNTFTDNTDILNRNGGFDEIGVFELYNDTSNNTIKLDLNGNTIISTTYLLTDLNVTTTKFSLLDECIASCNYVEYSDASGKAFKYNFENFTQGFNVSDELSLENPMKLLHNHNTDGSKNWQSPIIQTSDVVGAIDYKAYLKGGGAIFDGKYPMSGQAYQLFENTNANIRLNLPTEIITDTDFQNQAFSFYLEWWRDGNFGGGSLDIMKCVNTDGYDFSISQTNGVVKGIKWSLNNTTTNVQTLNTSTRNNYLEPFACSFRPNQGNGKLDFYPLNGDLRGLYFDGSSILLANIGAMIATQFYLQRAAFARIVFFRDYVISTADVARMSNNSKGSNVFPVEPIAYYSFNAADIVNDGTNIGYNDLTGNYGMTTITQTDLRGNDITELTKAAKLNVITHNKIYLNHIDELTAQGYVRNKQKLYSDQFIHASF